MIVLPDLLSMALLLRAVETGSLSKAAQQSHIALAAASRRIAMLEERYGVMLLYRSSQGVTLTPAGEAFTYHARLLLSQARRLQADLSDYLEGVRGHVRIQTNTSAMTQFVPNDLAEFSNIYPDVKIEMVENRSEDIVAALHDGRTDIGVIMEGVATDNLTCFEYRSDKLVAILPASHALQSTEVEFAELLKYDLIGLDGSAIITKRMATCAAECGERLKMRVQVRSFDAVSKLVQAGMGIGVMPLAVALNFADGMGLRWIHLSDAWATRKMYVCIREIETLPLVGRKLLEILVGTVKADS